MPKNLGQYGELMWYNSAVESVVKSVLSITTLFYIDQIFEILCQLSNNNQILYLKLWCSSVVRKKQRKLFKKIVCIDKHLMQLSKKQYML